MARSTCRVHLPSGDLCGKAGVDNWLVIPDGVGSFTGDLPICGIHKSAFEKQGDPLPLGMRSAIGNSGPYTDSTSGPEGGGQR